MINVFLVIQIIISVFLIGIILLQRESSDSLSGLSGGSGGIIGGALGAKAADNLLTKLTRYLACAFIINSLILGNLAAKIGKASSFIEKIEQSQPEAHKTVPVGE